MYVFCTDIHATSINAVAQHIFSTLTAASAEIVQYFINKEGDFRIVKHRLKILNETVDTLFEYCARGKSCIRNTTSQESEQQKKNEGKTAMGM